MSFLQYLPKHILSEYSEKEHKQNFPFLNYFEDSEVAKIENIIGAKINNIAFFEQAFTHSSYLQVLKSVGITALSNERLEFLGDAILELIVSDYLFNFHPTENEGYLSRIRAQFVNRHTLAKVANEIGLFEFLKASFATERDEKSNEKMMSNIYEAVLAAAFLDSGIAAAMNFVYTNLIPLLQLDNFLLDQNYKSILLEMVQAEGKDLPEYKVLHAIGPDHNKVYTIGVYLEGILIGQGIGKNKKTAEQNASQNALDNIMNT